MKRLLPFLVGVLILTGIAYALIPSLFPDTDRLPRIPTGDRSIGGMLSKILGTSNLGNYLGDGSVKNTTKLDNTTGTGYLKVQPPCSTAGEKWLGTDASGTPICGSTTPVLADYGKIDTQDCDAAIYHADNTFGNTATGDTLRAGDIVKTSPGCTMTIVFSDLSLVRLDGDTVVSFDIGYLPNGSTIASALLDNGSLWGRILTETGSYSVGTHEIIAGVRGTSISLISTGNTLGTITLTSTGWQIPRSSGTNNTQLQIVDTLASTGAATVICKDPTGGVHPLSMLPIEAGYSLSPGGCPTSNVAPPPPIATHPANTLFASSTWIRDNTTRDLSYMYHMLSLSGSYISPTKKTIIQNEISTTSPGMTGTGYTPLGALEASHLCPLGQRWWGERYGCQGSTVLAIADYSLPIPGFGSIIPDIETLNTSNGSMTPVTTNPTLAYLLSGQGVNINGTNAALDYNIPTLSTLIGTLTGHIINLEFQNPIATSGTVYIMNLGGNSIYRNSGTLKCTWRPLPNNCIIGTDTNLSNGDKIIEINLPHSLIFSGNTMKIGNNTFGTNPINNIVKNMSIK